MSKTKQAMPEQAEVDDSGYEQVKGDICAKLFAFQKLGITIAKDSKNEHFKNKYSSINEVLDKVKGILNEMGVMILQTPERDGLRTTLLNMDDMTEISCFLPYVEVTTAQRLGSSNTYNRRYSLVTMLCLEDEDDDANAASVSEVGEAVRNLARSKADNSSVGHYQEDDDLNF